MRKKIFSISFSILILSLLLLNIKAFAQAFNNNLLKTELSKSSVDGVNLTLSTSKAYNDKVVVNKKDNNEYVILMPETSNSIVAKPSLGSVSDVIENIDIKTQQFQGNIKGYTKITIKTTKPITINPKIQVVNVQNKLSDKDISELLSSSKNIAKTQKNNQLVKTVSKTKNIIVPANIQKEKVKTAENKKAVKVRNNKINVSKKIKIASNNTTKSNTENVAKQSKVENKANTSVQKPVELENEDVSQNVVDNENVSEPVSRSNVETLENEPELREPLVDSQQEASKTEQIIATGFGILNILKNHAYAFIAFIAVIFVFMLIVARNMARSIKNAKMAFSSNLNDKEDTVVDYTEKINDEMDWQEKFQTYVETKEENYSDENFADFDINKNANANIDDTEGLQDLFGTGGNLKTSNVDLSGENIYEDNILASEIFENKISENDNLQDNTLDVKQQNIQAFYNNINLDDYINEDNSFDETLSAEDLFADDEAQDMYSNLEFKTSQEIFENEFANSKMSIQDDVVTSEILNESLQKNEVENQSEQDIKDSDIVKSEFIIDENKGLYLVDYENTSALVGQINDKIFVLKRFEDKISSPLKARVNEEVKNSTRYMTRIGSFRGVVEVTPEKMNLLVEL